MRWLIGIVIVLGVLQVYSQSAKSLAKAGKKAYKQGKYETAVFYLSKALETEKTIPLAWYLAESARIIKDYETAEKWYQYIAENDITTYPLSTFWLGMVQKNLAKYQKAQISFRKYLTKNAAKKDYYTQKARHEVLSCENALMLTFDKNNVELTLLNSAVNSPYSEFQAYLDRDSLLWVSSYKPLENEDSITFTSKLLVFSYDNEWKQLPVDTNINQNEVLVSSFWLNPNRDKLILSLCSPLGNQYNCKLYKSYRHEKRWSKPEVLSTAINSVKATTTHPFLIETDSCRYLIFASDREGGFGKLDLWAVKVNELLEPVESVFNLGKNINSIDIECCPFYDLKRKTLYFSSEWNTNLGGTDVFSSYGWITNLHPPQNLGFPINTNYDETFFTISADRSKALLASNRSTHSLSTYEKCCNDIYAMEFEQPEKDTVQLEEKKQVVRKRLEDLIPINLYFHNDEPNPKTWDTTTSFAYDELYNRYVQMREEYISVYASVLKGDDKLQAESKIDAFFTEEVEKNYLKLLQFFQLMKQLLSEGEVISLTIIGYASPLNNHAYNLNLSKRRIQSLINLLYRFEDGFFLPYLNQTAENGAKLIIIREAYGENMVAQGVSDDLKNLRNSVYSPEASRERKIGIIAIKITAD